MAKVTAPTGGDSIVTTRLRLRAGSKSGDESPHSKKDIAGIFKNFESVFGAKVGPLFQGGRLS